MIGGAGGVGWAEVTSNMAAPKGGLASGKKGCCASLLLLDATTGSIIAELGTLPALHRPCRPSNEQLGAQLQVQWTASSVEQVTATSEASAAAPNEAAGQQQLQVRHQQQLQVQAQQSAGSLESNSQVWRSNRAAAPNLLDCQATSSSQSAPANHTGLQLPTTHRRKSS